MCSRYCQDFLANEQAPVYRRGRLVSMVMTLPQQSARFPVSTATGQSSLHGWSCQQRRILPTPLTERSTGSVSRREFSVRKVTVSLSYPIMNTFFHGWRRKVGVAALVMACIVTGVWIRSRDICDTIHFPFLLRQHRIHAVAGQIIWCAGSTEGRKEWGMESRIQTKDDVMLLYTEPANFIGVRGKWIIPLVWLAISLTLLSAYLILWKPRKRA
jgi:hypothetical protein